MDPVTEKLAIDVALQLIINGGALMGKLQSARAGGPAVTAQDVNDALNAVQTDSRAALIAAIEAARASANTPAA